MSLYKDTLNLPQTDFPMKANLANREPEMLSYWASLDLYQRLRKKGQGRPTFILHDGPPYANGDIHLGHAVNKILKDIIVKAKTLSGFDAPFVPGWDCHGLPIELNVEKKMGKAGLHISPKQFRAACREYAKEQVNRQSIAFQRLGVLGDWDSPYLTLDPEFEANVIRTLADILAQGHIERGYKPVHWCTECGSALAEAEVEYADKESPAIDILFRVVVPADLLNKAEILAPAHVAHEINCVIWTTTPWTLPANRAVAINPEEDYIIFSTHIGQRFCTLLVAEPLLQSFLNRMNASETVEIARIRGKALEGLLVQHPFYHRQVPLVLGEHVTMDTGTGCVHIAPAHGQEDYEVGLQYQLSVDHEVLGNGHFQADTPIVGGLYVFDANAPIIEMLGIQQTLLHQSKIIHSYPICWRHKRALIFRGTPQWFMSMEKRGLRTAVLKAIETVRWMPEWGQARISDMIAKRPDWCLSRQRNWGVPIPLFIHKDKATLHPDTPALMRKVADKVAEGGIDAWFDLDSHELLGSQAAEYDKLQDTLDVWFDSGSSFNAVLNQRPGLHSPADLYLEGSDQYRGWFHTSLLTSMAWNGQPPYKAVLSHGFTVDPQGRKMSKSLGNVLDPAKIVDTLGADILRLWVSSTDYRSDMALSNDILSRSADMYRRIRNTLRFLLANLAGFEPSQHQVEPTQLLSLDHWVLETGARLQVELQRAYDEYQFHSVSQKIHHFCSITLGSFYLDIIKDRQYTTQKDSLARRSAQTVMYHLAHALVRWLAPILSFTAEEVWRVLPGQTEDSVFLSTWYDFPALTSQTQTGEAFWFEISQVRDAVNKQLELARTQGLIGSGLEAEVTLYAHQALANLLSSLGEELRFVLITSKARVLIVEEPPQDVAATELSGLWISIRPSTAPKCERCWHRCEDIGTDATHPTLCQRCIENVAGEGEKRCFA